MQGLDRVGWSFDAAAARCAGVTLDFGLLTI